MNKTVLLSLDECDLTGAAINYTILTCIKPNDTLILISCANPSIPAGRSADGWLQVRMDEAARLNCRLKSITTIVMQELRRDDFSLLTDICLWKQEQANHTILMAEKHNPSNVILFFDPSQVSWIERTFHRTASTVISDDLISKHGVNPVILTSELLRRISDADIFGF